MQLRIGPERERVGDPGILSWLWNRFGRIPSSLWVWFLFTELQILSQCWWAAISSCWWIYSGCLDPITFQKAEKKNAAVALSCFPGINSVSWVTGREDWTHRAMALTVSRQLHKSNFHLPLHPSPRKEGQLCYVTGLLNPKCSLPGFLPGARSRS